MASTNVEIQVHVRRTGEVISMKVIPGLTTYGQIIETVCQRINEAEPSHYYITMNYQTEMEDHMIFKSEEKDQQFQLIMRTQHLLMYIAELALRRKQLIEEAAKQRNEASLPVSTEVSKSETTKITSDEKTDETSDDTIPKPNTPTSTTENKSQKGILQDVVNSAISKIPGRDVQEYLHQTLKKTFDILLMGSPRVGKSTLINAILKKDVAKTSSGRNACTTVVESYEYQETYTSSIEDTQITSTCSIRIWDAPGIEDWTRIDVAKHLRNLVEEKNPICLIYCASPGSYSDLEHVKTIVEECKKLKLFVAMVVTNMYASDEADIILKTFQNILARHHEQTKVDGEIFHYGPVGLCAQVNSSEYKAMGVTMQQDGVYELMLGIMSSLSEDKLLQWCFALMDNGPFWMRRQRIIWKMFGFINVSTPFYYVKNLIGF